MCKFIIALCTIVGLGCIVSPDSKIDGKDPTTQSPDDSAYQQKPYRDSDPCDQPTITYVVVGDQTWAVELPTLCTYEFPWDQGDPPPDEESSVPELTFQDKVEGMDKLYDK